MKHLSSTRTTRWRLRNCSNNHQLCTTASHYKILTVYEISIYVLGDMRPPINPLLNLGFLKNILSGSFMIVYVHSSNTEYSISIRNIYTGFLTNALSSSTSCILVSIWTRSWVASLKWLCIVKIFWAVRFRKHCKC